MVSVESGAVGFYVDGLFHSSVSTNECFLGNLHIFIYTCIQFSDMTNRIAYFQDSTERDSISNYRE